MSRSQAGSLNSTKKQQPVKAKTKAVHKEAAFRQVASDWNQKSKEVQGLDILERCKKLNAFLSKGLLGEVELDDELLAACSAGPKQQFKTAAVQQQQLRASAEVQATGSQAVAISTPRQQPLTSRITAKESAALLELLETDEPEQPAAVAPSSREPAEGHQIHRGSQDCEGTGTASSCKPGASASTAASCSSSGAAEAGASSCATTPASKASALHHLAHTADQVVADDDDDLIGLLNQPTSSSTSDPAATTAEDFRAVLVQQRAAITIQRHVRGLIVRRRLAAVLQAATCLQALYRCSKARHMLQQMHQDQQQREQQLRQQQLRQPANAYCKQESIDAAWRGYYQTHGQQAACTVQRYWRGYRAKRVYQQQQAAAAVLQACCTGWLVRQATADLLHARLQEQQHKLQQQQVLNMQRQQRREAAIVLQAMCRGWLARRQLQQLAKHDVTTTAAGGGHTAEPSQQAAVEAAEPFLRDVVHGPGNSCYDEDEAACATKPDSTINPVSSGSSSTSSSRCSSGKANDDRVVQDRSRSSKLADAGASRGASSSSKLAPSQGSRHASRGISSKQMAEQPLPAQQPAVVHSRSSSGSGTCRPTAGAVAVGAADSYANLLAGRHLVIRSAADMRTATQHGDGSSTVGETCTEHLARQLVWRAGELKAGEELQQAELALRTSMAGSSFRKLQEAMAVVKSRRDTS